MKNKCKSLKKKNQEQAFKLKTLKANSMAMKEKAEVETFKLDSIDQYSQRQNLEFKGIPVTENKDVVDIVVKVGNLISTKVKRSDN